MQTFEYRPEGAGHKQIRLILRHNKNRLMREAPKELNFKVTTNLLPEGQLSKTYSYSIFYLNFNFEEYPGLNGRSL